MLFEESQSSAAQRTFSASGRILRRLHLDGPLLASLAVVIAYGLFVLYSATGQNLGQWLHQVELLGLACGALLVLAQVPPAWLKRLSPAIYATGILLLVAVTVAGTVGKGAQRWLSVGVIRFQPSEIMKLGVPMMCAWYLRERPLPPSARDLVLLGLIVLVPTILIAKQPDLGTAILVAAAGFAVIFLSGLGVWVMVAGLVALGAAVPVVWHFMHDYQKQRIITFLDPSRDALGAGYHTIQSQIAIGSGGVFGKWWTHGSQAQLEFLPERSTDFIFAVIGEELGFLGQMLLLAMYLVVIGRILYMASEAQDTYARLICGSLGLTFFVYVFVNTGMVSGILPVVGVPLPLVSYGGTSMVTLLSGFGILMSLYRHRKLVGS